MASELVPMNKQLSELVTENAPLTAKQAKDGIQLFLTCDAMRRRVLLALFDRGAHTALGFDWDVFCADHLNMAESSYSRNLLRWGRVERAVASQMLPTGNIYKLTKICAMELAKLDSDEEIAAAWAELNGFDGAAGLIGKEAAMMLRKIVTRRLNLLAPGAAPVAETSDEAAPQEAVAAAEPPVPTVSVAPAEPEAEVAQKPAKVAEELPPQIIGHVEPKRIVATYEDCVFGLKVVTVEFRLPDGRGGQLNIPRYALK